MTDEGSISDPSDIILRRLPNLKEEMPNIGFFARSVVLKNEMNATSVPNAYVFQIVSSLGVKELQINLYFYPSSCDREVIRFTRSRPLEFGSSFDLEIIVRQITFKFN